MMHGQENIKLHNELK